MRLRSTCAGFCPSTRRFREKGMCLEEIVAEAFTIAVASIVLSVLFVAIARYIHERWGI